MRQYENLWTTRILSIVYSCLNMVKILTNKISVELSEKELDLLLEAFCVYRNKLNLIVSRNFLGKEKTANDINHLYDRIRVLLTKTI